MPISYIHTITHGYISIIELQSQRSHFFENIFSRAIRMVISRTFFASHFLPVEGWNFILNFKLSHPVYACMHMVIMWNADACLPTRGQMSCLLPPLSFLYILFVSLPHAFSGPPRVNFPSHAIIHARYRDTNDCATQMYFVPPFP